MRCPVMLLADHVLRAFLLLLLLVGCGLGADPISDADWSSMGVPPGPAGSSGPGGTITGMASMGSSLVITGNFRTIGAAPIAYIAVWDGSTWSTLGGGLDGPVFNLASTGTDLYVCGIFTHAGGVPAQGLAHWDGTAWSAVPWTSTGLQDMAADAGCLYTLDYSGNIASWNGSMWQQLGSASYGSKLAAAGGVLYASGSFTSIGGVPAQGLAQWNGSVWSPVGAGATGSFIALAASGSSLVIAGGSPVGMPMTSSVWRWDGAAWTALGTGPYGWSVTTSGSDIFASYYGGIGHWNGTSWSQIPFGYQTIASRIAVVGTHVYAVDLTRPGGSVVSHLADWDGTSWSAMASGTGLDGEVWRMAFSDDGSELYAGGMFNTGGGSVLNCIAAWDGNTWNSMGSGVGNRVQALAVSGSTVYAAGNFWIGSPPVPASIARWDGTAWYPVAGAPSYWVNALAVFGGKLYAGGSFTSAGGAPASYIVCWDGTAWSPVGGGTDNAVIALLAMPDGLYAGGTFQNAGGAAASRLAKWDGSSWSQVGGGVDGEVDALAASGTRLCVGGGFNHAGGVLTNRIAVWNGQAWSAPLAGMSTAYVNALALSGSTIYAGGAFMIGGAYKSLVQWDGTTWSVPGSGVDAGVATLAKRGTSLYVGGSFIAAGGQPSAFAARLSVPLADQHIYFLLAGPVTFGVAPMSLTASSDSALPVGFSVVSGPATVSGSTLTITGAGSVVVAADQPGNADFAAAPQVTQTLTVSQAAQTLTFAAIGDHVFGVAPLTLSATATSGLVPVFSVVSGPATVSGTTLTITGAGTVLVAANQPGNADFAVAPQVTQTITVSKAVQTITFAAIGDQVFGVAPLTLSATATSGMAPAFSVVSGPATVSGTTLTITGAGTVVVAANQPGNVDFAAAPQVTQTIMVSKAVQTITFAAIGDQVFGVAPLTLSATASSGLVPVFSVVSGPATVSGTTLTITGAGTVVVAADQPGNVDFAAAPQVTRTIAISKAAQTIAFAAIGDQVFGVAPLTLSATASSGLVPVFSVVSGPATVSGATLTITGAGTVVVAADQPGNADFAAAPQVTQTITISKSAQTITFAAIGDQVFGVAPLTLSATASSGLVPVFSVVSGPATVSGTTLTITGAGTVVVAADQPGNADYAAAPQVVQTITVAKAPQTIDFTAIPPQVLGAPPIPLIAHATSGLAPVFGIVSGPGVVSGASLTLTGVGTVVVAADQPGDADHAAAPRVTRSVVVTRAGGHTGGGSGGGGGGGGCGAGALLGMALLLVRLRGRPR